MRNKFIETLDYRIIDNSSLEFTIGMKYCRVTWWCQFHLINNSRKGNSFFDLRLVERCKLTRNNVKICSQISSLTKEIMRYFTDQSTKHHSVNYLKLRLRGNTTIARKYNYWQPTRTKIEFTRKSVLWRKIIRKKSCDILQICRWNSIQ